MSQPHHVTDHEAKCQFSRAIHNILQLEGAGVGRVEARRAVAQRHHLHHWRFGWTSDGVRHYAP